MLTQAQFAQRNQIIFGTPTVDWGKHFGGTMRYQQLELEALNQLIQHNLIELGEQQNDAPTVEECQQFLTKYPFLTVHGYVVSPDRSDTRVSIEGFELKEGIFMRDIFASEKYPDFSEDWSSITRNADEIDEETYYAWWD